MVNNPQLPTRGEMSKEKKPQRAVQGGEKRNPKGQFVEGNVPANKVNTFHYRATKFKDSMLDAFKSLGGVAGLVKWAKKSDSNKREFYKMVVSLVPKDIKIEGEGIGNIYQLIQIIQQDIHPHSEAPLELDHDDSKDEGRTRQREPDKEIPG